jgi:hypothetical protein
MCLNAAQKAVLREYDNGAHAHLLKEPHRIFSGERVDWVVQQLVFALRHACSDEDEASSPRDLFRIRSEVDAAILLMEEIQERITVHQREFKTFDPA